MSVGFAAGLALPPLRAPVLHAVLATLSLVATLAVGFLTLVSALLATRPGGRPWTFLREAGRLSQLVAYVRWPLNGGVALLGVSLLLACATGDGRGILRGGVALAAALLAFVVSGLVRLTRILLVLARGL